MNPNPNGFVPLAGAGPSPGQQPLADRSPVPVRAALAGVLGDSSPGHHQNYNPQQPLTQLHLHQRTPPPASSMQVPPNPHDPTQGGSPYQPAFLAHPYSPQQQQAQLHRDLSATSSASAATSSSNSPSGAPSGTPSSASTPMPISIAPIASLAGGNGNGAGNGGNGGHSLMPPASASPSFGVHVSVSTNQAIALADSRVLQSLIMRIVDKLPIKSGIPLSLLEQDDGMNQSVISLITLAQWRLGDIMVMLLKALDSIANSAMQKQQMSQEDPYASVDIVQSQLFVLRLMATCMALHWKRQRDSLSPFGERAAKRRIPSVLGSSGGGAGANSNISHAPVTLSPRPVKAQSSFDLTSLRGSSASPALEGRNALGTPPQPNASAITAASLMGVSSGPQPIFMDPPALEEHLAKQVLTAVSRYFFTSSAAINADTISHSFLSEFTSLNPLGLATPNSNIAAFFMTEEATKERLFATPVASPDYMVELQRAAGRVLFFLSSSNWFIVFNRIKAKLQMLGQRGGDENALDLTELRFIEWSNFDRSRLTLMLSEVNPAIKTYPKNAQFLLAIVLRRGIWNWIETHPLEFGVLYSSQKRLEGGPDSLFDNLTSISEMSSRKKAIFWPTQMMLLILCPDILHAMTSKNDKEVSPAGTKMIVPTNVVSKKQSWLDSVRRGLKQKRGEVALLCLVDVCKASTFLNKVDGSPLRFLVPNIEAEVKEKLFAPILSMNYSIDDIEIDMKMSTDCATALYRLNAWNQLKTLNVGLTDPAAPLIYKAILIRGCLDIVSEENALPWNPMIDASLAAPIRQLFSASIVRGDPRVETVKRNLRKAITIVDEGMDKIEIVISILKIWSRCPVLIIAKDASIIGMEELRSVVNGICSAVVDPNESIRTHAAECIRALMNADAIPYWDGTTPDWASPVPGRPSESSMYVFLRTSSQILVMLSRSLVNQEQIQEGANAPVSQRVKMTLCLLRDLLQMRNAYLSARRAVAAVGITSAERSAATASMEVSLLVLLCSADTEITTMAISCIGYLIDEADLVGETSLAAAMPAAHPDLEYESDPNAEIITVQSPTVGHGTLVNPVAGTNSPLNFPGGANGVVQAATSPAMTPVSAPSALHFHNPLLQLEGGLLPQPSSIIENLAVYRELRTLYVQGSVVTGQKALQKRIRKVLRKSERPTAGNMGAWEQIYKRWRSLSTALGTKNGVVSGLGGSAVVAETFEDKGDWQNYTGFLCALGGVCLQASDIFDEQVRKETQQLGIRDENFSMDELDNYASGAGHLGSYANVRAIVEKFITELINLLVCDNVVVREAVKEFLGNELNHRLFDALLAHYENIVTRFLTTPEQVSVDRNILFVESAISVLKMILERTADPTDQSSMLMELPGDVDVGSLVISFFKFLNRLSLFYAVPPHIAMRIKVKMCQLVEVVIAKREFIALRQDIRVRNMLMEALLDWNSGVQELEVYKDPDAKNHKLFMDLDLGSMKAMVAVLNGLPLQPSSEMITTVSLNAQQTSATVTEDFDGYDAAKEAKDRLFRKYLEFFLRALEKFKALEEHFFAKQELATRTNSVAGTSLAGSASSEPSLVMSSKAKEALVYLNNLKDYTILALSNLLAANIDIGLKFSLSMGYHYDLKMRAAFMQVLVNLLDSGAAEQFASLGEEGVVLRARYEKMLEMVVSHDLSVVLALAEADTEDVAGTLLAVFEAKGQSERLITALLEQEVARTEYAYDLLRRNSVTSRLLTHLARSRGRDYIVDTLRPVIQELLAFNPTLTFEIDPVKMTERDDATINMRNLKMLIRKLLDSITNHTDRFPDSLRSVCHSISTIAGRKFPEARVTSIGAFVFLRFICPAIVAPESHDVVPMFSSKDIRRGLVLAAKVVQNLANNVLFGTKEKFMEDLNDSLRKNIGRVHAFLRNISTLPELPTGSPLHIEINATGANSGADVSEYDLMRLHRLLALNLDRIEASNEFAIGVPGRSDENTALRKRRFRELSTLIAQLGPAPEMARLRQALISKESHGKGRRMSWLFTSSATDSAQALTEFMTRVQQRSGSDKALEVLRERNIFFASGRSKDRIPVLYFIARKVQPDSIDMDLVLFHMLTVAQAMGNQPFDLVVDVTHFNVENQWDLEYISKLNELIPTAFKTNLKTLIVYSCNSIFLKYFTTFLGVTEISVQAKILFVSTITEILNHIPSTDLALPESTLAVERDVTAVFSPVNRITENRQQMPVILKVGPESLHLTWVDRFEILGSNACITDIFRFSEVEEVISVGEDGEFLIKHIDRSNGSSFLGVSGGGAVSSTLSTMVFRSPKRDGIITAVRMAKSRFRKSRPQNVVSDSKNLRAADVPGTLLNMAMLNLGTMDPYLRLMSYNLLDSVGRGFSFDIGNQLLSAKGLCIPANNQSFVLSVSTHLAATHPELTVEFLIEAIHGLRRSTKELKLFCLEYMYPWLPNLETFTNTSRTRGPSVAPLPSTPDVGMSDDSQIPALSAKMVGLMKLFIEMTVKEVEVFAVIQSKIWTPLAKVNGALPLILNAFFQTAVEAGLGSSEVEILANTMATLASVDLRQVSRRLIDRTLSAITSSVGLSTSSTDLEPSPSLTKRSQWSEIAVLVRFLLMLSFHDKLDVRTFLPNLCQIIVLLVGLGRPLIRASVHGITINLVHSLCTLQEADPATLQGLRVVLAELSDPKVCLLFGVGGSLVHERAGMLAGRIAGGWSPSTSNSAFQFASDALGGDVLHEISLANLESVVNLLLQVVAAADTMLGSDLKSQWASLIMEVTFQPNPAVQPRTFIALGALSREGTDDTTILLTLSSLYTRLNSYDDMSNSMVVSIIICLTNMAKGLDSKLIAAKRMAAKGEEVLPIDHHRLLLLLTWVGISLIQMANPQVFSAAAQLVEVALRRLDATDSFQELGLADTLIQARVPLQDAANELDRSFNVWFGADFSLAMTVNLIRGLKHHSTRGVTLSLLKTLLEISGRVEGRSAGVAGGFPAEWVGCITDYGIGFLVALLPSAAKPFELFKFGGVPAEDVERASASVEFASAAARYRAIISLFPPMTDEYRAMTINSLMVVLLENAESDMDARFIYGFLAESAIANPEVFSLIYESLLSRMQGVVATSQVPETLDSVQSIFCTMLSKTPANAQSQANTHLHPSRRTSISSTTSSAVSLLGSGTGVPFSGGFTAPLAAGSAPPIPTAYGNAIGRRTGSQSTNVIHRDSSSTQAGGPPLSTLMTITPDDVASGVNTSVSGIQPSMLSANVPAVNFLNELGFKGLAEMGSFNCITRSIRMSNSRLVAIVVRMVAELVQHVPDDKDISSAPVRLETEE